MGITFSFKTKINVNGREYGSLDDMPAEERSAYEAAIAGVKRPADAENLLLNLQTTTRKFIVNGKEYGSVDAMPPEARALYERAMASASGQASNPATPLAPPASSPVVRSPLNLQAEAGPPRRSKHWMAIIIGAAVVGIITMLFLMAKWRSL